MLKGELRERFVENESSHRNHQSGLFRERDKRTHVQHAVLGVLPSHQSFESIDPAGFKRDDGLINHAQLIALKGATQILLA